MAGKLAAIMLNPKTLEPCEIRYVGTRPSVFLLGDNERICKSWFDPDEQGPGDRYVRIHSAGAFNDGKFGTDVKGKGYGLLLYCGSALIAQQEFEDCDGVCSNPNNRTGEADDHWRSLRKTGLAVQHEGDLDYDDPEEHETTMDDFCVRIPDDDRYVDDADGEGNSGYVTDREVCGTVDVTVSIPRERNAYDTLDADDVVNKTRLVLALADADEETEEDVEKKLLPTDALLNVKITSFEMAKRYAKVLEVATGDMDVVNAFMSRADVMELLGQQRLPGINALGGIAALRARGLSALGRPATKVPAMSASSKALLDKLARYAF
jgi:hypothetical protein